MKLENRLDKILDILYDKNELKFKKVPTTDIVIFGKEKYKLDWSDAEVMLIMGILQEEGYVAVHKGGLSGNNIKIPAYSLTTKGIRLKQNGGFVLKQRIEWLTNFLIISASVVTIIVGIATGFDFYNKYLKTNIQNRSANQSQPNNGNYDTTHNSATNTMIKSDNITKTPHQKN